MHPAFSARLPSLKPWFFIRLLLSCLLLLMSAAQAAEPDLAAAPATPTLAECQGMKDLAFVGHMDDDLLFMNPDIESVIRDGGCVRVVYLTASERNEGQDYMLSRERGVQAAYAYMAGQNNDWIAGSVQVGAYQLAAYTLRDRPGIQLWHMRLRDPWLGKGWGSLTPLSQTESIPGMPVDTLEAQPQRYTRADLVDTLATIVRGYTPTSIRHLDDTIDVPYTQLCWRCPGHGHPDHIASARLVREAMQQAPGNYKQTAYHDYPIQEYVSNLTPDEIHDKTEAFRRYAWVDYRYCKGPDNCREPAGPAAAWVGRAYYVSRHDTTAMLASAAPNPSDAPWLLTTGERNDAISLWRSPSQAWEMLGGRSSDAPIVATSAQGATHLMARDTVGRIWVKQAAADGRWTPWQAIPGARLSRSPAIVSGDAIVVGLGTDERYYWSAADSASSSWRDWAALPVLPGALGNSAAALSPQGRLVVAAVDAQGKLYIARQLASHSTNWSPWQAVAAPPAAPGLAILYGADGRLSLYLRHADTQQLWQVTQLKPTSIGDETLTWQAALDLGLRTDAAPAAALDQHGHAVLVARAADDAALWVLRDGKRLKLAQTIASAPVLQALQGELYLNARLPGPQQRYQVWHNNSTQWQALSLIEAPPESGGYAFQTPATPLAQPPVVAHQPAH